MYSPLLSQLMGFRIRRPQILRAELLAQPEPVVAGPKAEEPGDKPPLAKLLRKRRQNSQALSDE